MRVAWLHVAPIKSLAIQERDRVDLRRHGVDEDRRFLLIDDDGRLMNGKRLARLQAVRPAFDAEMRRLTLTMPDGARVEGAVELGVPVQVSIYKHEVSACVVEGPWAERLSKEVGHTVRLVKLDRPGDGVDRARHGAGASLLSVESLRAMAAVAGLDEPPDARRFRMLIGVEGGAAHQEDGWVGKRVRVGDAVVIPAGNVGRCVVTTRDPDTGESDLDTLEILARYRRDMETTEELPFGVWARVVREGTVKLGDEIVVE